MPRPWALTPARARARRWSSWTWPGASPRRWWWTWSMDPSPRPSSAGPSATAPGWWTASSTWFDRVRGALRGGPERRRRWTRCAPPLAPGSNRRAAPLNLRAYTADTSHDGRPAPHPSSVRAGRGTAGRDLLHGARCARAVAERRDLEGRADRAAPARQAAQAPGQGAGARQAQVGAGHPQGRPGQAR